MSKRSGVQGPREEGQWLRGSMAQVVKKSQMSQMDPGNEGVKEVQKIKGSGVQRPTGQEVW